MGTMKNKVRFYLGLSCFVLSWILPLFGFLVARLDLSLAARATIIGLLTVGGPEILGILAVVCLGKENLVYIKDKILGYVKLIKPSGSVGRRRYRVGLVMFLLAPGPHLYHGLCAPMAAGPVAPAPLRQPGRGLYVPEQPFCPGR